MSFYYNPMGNYEGKLSWLNFVGRWENPEEGCDLSFIPVKGKGLLKEVAKECILTSGPNDPMNRDEAKSSFMGLQ